MAFTRAFFSKFVVYFASVLHCRRPCRIGRAGVPVWLLALLCATPAPAVAQALSRLASSAEAFNKKHIRLRAVTGHPCLDFRMRVRPETVMDRTFDHVVEIGNSCTRRIAVRVCYKDTTTCQSAKVSPRNAKVILLGVVRDRPTFTFDYVEAFDD